MRTRSGEGLARFADAGATDFAAVEIGLDGDEFARTRALLKEIHAGLSPLSGGG